MRPPECLLPESLYEHYQIQGFPEVAGRLVWSPVEDWRFDNEGDPGSGNGTGLDQKLRLRFMSDGWGASEGVFLDNLQVLILE